MAIRVHLHPRFAEPYLAALRQTAPEVPVWLDDDPHDPAQVELLLAWSLTPGLVGSLPRLRAVCSIGAGVDKLLAAPDLPLDLPVLRVSDPQQNQAIAQYVLACALRHLRELPRYEAQQAEARWRRHTQRPLGQCRLGLLGQGAVAQAVARAAQALGLPVALWGRGPRDLPPDLAGLRCEHGEAGLARLLAASDVLVCTLPLTPATENLLDRARLSQLPRGAYLIQVGRGEQLVDADLRALLDEGHLAGAALDVYRVEPSPPEHWAWRHPLVFASPHIAGEARHALVAATCLGALQALREGRQPDGVVDRAAGY